MKIQRMDHIGILVNDLPKVKAFFLDVGLEMDGEGKVEGEWAKRMEKIMGLQAIQEDTEMPQTTDNREHIELVVLGTPDGDTKIELVKLNRFSDDNNLQHPVTNNWGSQHIAFAVEDIESLVTKLKKSGAAQIGDIQNYENTYKLCFVRGPEGILLELAEDIK